MKRHKAKTNRERVVWFCRRVRRAQMREKLEMRGFKRGRALNSVLAREPGESFATHARRYVRLSYQAQDIRRASKGHRPPPAGMTDRTPLTVKP